MQHREPLDAIAGAIGGALFAFCVWLGLIISAPAFLASLLLPWIAVERAFPFDVLVLVTVGAVVGSVLGYWKGTAFFQWVRDHWPGSDPS